MRQKSFSFQPLPVLNSNCFTRNAICPSSKNKDRPMMVLTVPLEENEKEVTVQRIPLVIEYLQNNWTLHGWQRKKSNVLDKKSTSPIEATTSVAYLSHQPRTKEQENAESSEESPQQRETPSGKPQHSKAIIVSSNGSVAMEEVADKLRQSALQSATAKRRHVSLAEQAMLEMENEAEMETNDEQMTSGDGHSQPAVSFVDQSSFRSVSGDDGKSRDVDALDVPPPTKHGRMK